MSIPLFGALEAVALSPSFLFVVIGLATGAVGFMLGVAAERRRRKTHYFSYRRELEEQRILLLLRNALLYSTSAALGLLLLFQPLLTAGPPTFWTVVTWILFLLLTWGVFYTAFEDKEAKSSGIRYSIWFIVSMIVFAITGSIIIAIVHHWHIHYGYGFIGAFLVAVAIGRLSAYHFVSSGGEVNKRADEGGKVHEHADEEKRH